MNRNKNKIKLDIGLQSGILSDFDPISFTGHFKTPLHTVKLKLPSLLGIPHKLKLSQNIEKLTLQRSSDIENIDFTENVKLKHICINDFRTSDQQHSIPTNVVKICIDEKPKCFVLPPHVRFLKVRCIEYMNVISLSKDSELEKINVTDYDTIPKKVVNLSHIYNLKIIKARAGSRQTEFLKKMKLPYGTVAEFY